MKPEAVQQVDDHRIEATLQPTTNFKLTESLKFAQESGATNALDEFAEDFTTLRSHVYLNIAPYRLELRAGDDGTLLLTVQSPDDSPTPDEDAVQHAVDATNHRFFLDVEMKAVKKALEVDKYGKELSVRFYPTRPSNYPSAWDALLKSVVHAQIYPGFAAQLDDRLRQTYGSRVEFNGEPIYLFPTPEQLIPAEFDDLRGMKFSRQKADYMMTIPRQILDEPEKFDFAAMRDRPGEEVVTTLKELHGVGDWTAQNVAMRGIPHKDVFIDEKATRAELSMYYGEGAERKITKRGVEKAVEQFAPYRTFACYYTYMKHFA